MQAWTENLFIALSRARGADALFAQIVESARRLGFDQCAYGLRLPLPFTNPRTYLINNYDPRWQHRYVDAGYLAIDPTVRQGQHSQIPIVWTDELFRRTPQFWEEASSFGLRVGWAQSCFDGNGAVGLLSLARAHGSLTSAELRAKEPYMRWLVNVAHIALSAALSPPSAQAAAPLSAREAEVLRWTADGKTAADAATILGISVDTVNFHVKNTLGKVGAANKAAAAARAAVLGLLR